MSKLKYDGYYYHLTIEEKKIDSYINIFRFFEKTNKVISVACSPNYNKAPIFGNFFPSDDWFNENYENNGNYNITDDKISFTCGKVEYKGTILSQDKLELFFYSKINGNEGKIEYKFISFEVLNDIRALEDK